MAFFVKALDMSVPALAFLLLTSLACSTTSRALSPVNGIDVYGSKRITAAAIIEQYGSRIEDWVRSAKSGRSDYAELKQNIESSIQSQFGFAYVGLSLTTYFPPHAGDYVTVDVVEKEAAAERMAFLPEPKGHFEDPDGLIALWENYFLTGVELHRLGPFEFPPTCPAWHCVYGFEHPKLAPFLRQFDQLVPRNEKRLARILSQDRRAHFRANAALLLAHLKSRRSVVKYALTSVRDPSDMVRNNVIRVLGQIAQKDPAAEIPLAPILQALNFPTTTDRNKAAYVLVSLSQNDQNKQDIVKSVGPILLNMLKLRQPNNHEPAYAILKNVSGQNFGARDYSAWKDWVLQNSGRPNCSEN